MNIGYCLLGLVALVILFLVVPAIAACMLSSQIDQEQERLGREDL